MLMQTVYHVVKLSRLCVKIASIHVLIVSFS